MWQLAFFYFVNNLGLVFCLFISLVLKYLVPFRPSGSDAEMFLSINHFWDFEKNLYISVQSSVFGIHVTATKGCHNNFYGWVCCEWSYYKGDLVSFITHFKGVGKRRGGLSKQPQQSVSYQWWSLIPWGSNTLHKAEKQKQKARSKN